MIDRSNITTDDIQRALSAGGMSLTEWNGSDNVNVTIPNPLQPWCSCNATVTINSIINWLNLDLGFFDPVAMGM